MCLSLACLPACMHAYLPACLSACLSLRLPLYLCVCLSQVVLALNLLEAQASAANKYQQAQRLKETSRNILTRNDQLRSLLQPVAYAAPGTAPASPPPSSSSSGSVARRNYTYSMAFGSDSPRVMLSAHSGSASGISSSSSSGSGSGSGSGSSSGSGTGMGDGAKGVAGIGAWVSLTEDNIPAGGVGTSHSKGGGSPGVGGYVGFGAMGGAGAGAGGHLLDGKSLLQLEYADGLSLGALLFLSRCAAIARYYFSHLTPFGARLSLSVSLLCISLSVCFSLSLSLFSVSVSLTLSLFLIVYLSCSFLPRYISCVSLSLDLARKVGSQ